MGPPVLIALLLGIVATVVIVVVSNQVSRPSWMQEGQAPRHGPASSVVLASPVPLTPAASPISSSPPDLDSFSLNYTHTTYGFSVRYPKDWTVEERSQDGLLFIKSPIRSPDERHSQQIIQISASPRIGPHQLDLGAYIDSRPRLAPNDWSELRRYPTQLGGHSAITVENTYFDDLSDGKLIQTYIYNPISMRVISFEYLLFPLHSDLNEEFYRRFLSTVSIF